MSAQPVVRITPEQYLEAERKAEFKHEYFDGEVFAMSGGTYPHGTIIADLTAVFWNALQGPSCTVTSNDVRLRVGSGRLYTYPDLAIACGAPRFADDQKDTLLNPTLIVEVLSIFNRSPRPRPEIRAVPNHSIAPGIRARFGVRAPCREVPSTTGRRLADVGMHRLERRLPVRERKLRGPDIEDLLQRDLRSGGPAC